jgi:hypothetical protein
VDKIQANAEKKKVRLLSSVVARWSALTRWTWAGMVNTNGHVEKFSNVRLNIRGSLHTLPVSEKKYMTKQTVEVISAQPDAGCN